jgi:hypothetical protein
MTMVHTVDNVSGSDDEQDVPSQSQFRMVVDDGQDDDDFDDAGVDAMLTVDWEDIVTDADADVFSVTGTDREAPETAGSVVTVEPSLTGRPPNGLYLSCDPDHLSPYQVAVRRHIEAFEAHDIDVDSGAQGRNRPVVLGQLGIRCRWCAHVAPKERTRGAVYYPSKLLGVYQAAQNLAKNHLCESCTNVPANLRTELCLLRDKKSSVSGGKGHWAKALEALSVHEDEHGLRYGHFLGSPHS